MSNQLITKSNELIDASYRLSLNELRVVLYGISLINPMNKDFPMEYKIEISRFADLFGVDKNGLYSDIKASIIKRFWQREFTYQLEDGKKRLGRWLDQIEYNDGDGYIKVFFSERVKPFLHKLQNNFTTYRIDQIAHFKSANSVRIYEICIMNYNRYASAPSNQNRTSITFKITLEELKERLELTDKYQRFFDFNNRVLEVSKKEINRYSDITIDYEIKKTGHHYEHITFKVKKKPTQNQNKQSLSKKIHELEVKISEYHAGVNSLIAQRHEPYRLEQEELLKNAIAELETVKNYIPKD